MDTTTTAMTELSDAEMDEWTVPLRQFIKLFTEERERSNAQVAALLAEIDDLRRLLAARRDLEPPDRAPAVH